MQYAKCVRKSLTFAKVEMLHIKIQRNTPQHYPLSFMYERFMKTGQGGLILWRFHLQTNEHVHAARLYTCTYLKILMLKKRRGIYG